MPADILVGLSLVLLGAVERQVRMRSRAHSSPSSDWTFAFISIVANVSIVGAGIAAYFDVAPFPGSPWWPVIAGLVLMWIGEAFRLWAIFSLGAFFNVMVVVREHHHVVDRGPYRWLRHPSYLGMIVALVGIGLALGDIASTVTLLVVSLAMFLVRIRVEERALLQALGDEYHLYMRRTARLLPGVF